MRHFPVRPHLDQLKQQAKDLLRDLRRGDPPAVAELHDHHPESPSPSDAKLADAQLTLARSYGLASWLRLVLACRVTDAIQRDDVAALRQLMLKHPRLLHEMACGTEKHNWGPPMTYAANLGRERIVTLLHDLGATDVQWAFGRACLQGQTDTARRLYAMGARPQTDSVMGPAETLNDTGMALLLELGAEIGDGEGHLLAPVALALETYSRNPPGKHRCLELFVERGIDLPDTPPMAVHRGRIDLLENHLRRNPDLLERTFTHRDIYPPEMGCHEDESLALHGTPLAGGTLLHLCVEYGEEEIARWLIERGMDVNAKAAVDDDGFGGHTALFGCVVSYLNLNKKQESASLARLLLDHGADPALRASLRKRLRFRPDESLHEYHEVTPLAWGTRFHDQRLVSRPTMQEMAERGGQG
jgi:hypothetical protein